MPASLFPQASKAPVGGNRHRLTVLVQAGAEAMVLNPEESELLSKMLRAIGVGMEEALVLPSNSVDEPAIQTPVLTLGDVGARPTSCPNPVIRTLHPRDLIQDPAKKRQAWIDLQRLQKHLSRCEGDSTK